MRQVKVDHEEEIKRLNDEIDRLIQKRAYGTPSSPFGALINTYTESSDQKSTMVNKYEKSVDMDSFDYDLMNACLAKYGMKCTNVEYGGYRDEGYFMHCSLHDEKSADLDEEV
mmetsp:Transcript_17542/g.29693  ORF Transcript_17542/g.29693 Transcript_17542/m.29693 type:complete len:113 (+) Transcript_17542:305-643(+)